MVWIIGKPKRCDRCRKKRGPTNPMTCENCWGRFHVHKKCLPTFRFECADCGLLRANMRCSPDARSRVFALLKEIIITRRAKIQAQFNGLVVAVHVPQQRKKR